MNLASLPTPVREHSMEYASIQRRLSIKYDNLTGSLYGGNKLRKLEYIFPRVIQRKCMRVATFGAVGSNHALATALYATQCGFDCTCFLVHQAKTRAAAATINKHIENGTELVRFGGDYATRIDTLRKHLRGRHAWVIPMGGSSWLGNIGFVAAGLELADQVSRGEISLPDRIYVATGTMGTAVGIALGVSIAGLGTEVHAVRVSDTPIMNRDALQRLLAKTALMMRRLDDSVPADLASRANIRVRDEFFGPGYAQGTEQTEEAIGFARDALDLPLETTYTGKAMAALLSDWRACGADEFNALYWHTYNSTPLDVPTDRPLDPAAIPGEFLRYFEA
ncbi:MAG: pyridoxal-phosphate dependent enzyme [Gammaproteobacteria bacterium]|nr:pyridoxal-phosphate dependent enzyme [Gammaproteobacteria bacterium]